MVVYMDPLGKLEACSSILVKALGSASEDRAQKLEHKFIPPEFETRTFF